MKRLITSQVSPFQAVLNRLFDLALGGNPELFEELS